MPERGLKSAILADSLSGCMVTLGSAAEVMSYPCYCQLTHPGRWFGGGGQCPCLELALLTVSCARSGNGILL